MIIIWTGNLIVKRKKLFLGLNSTKVALWLKKCTLLAQKGAAYLRLPLSSSAASFYLPAGTPIFTRSLLPSWAVVMRRIAISWSDGLIWRGFKCARSAPSARLKLM
jgi:hypothetical protein